MANVADQQEFRGHLIKLVVMAMVRADCPNSLMAKMLGKTTSAIAGIRHRNKDLAGDFDLTQVFDAAEMKMIDAMSKRLPPSVKGSRHIQPTPQPITLSKSTTSIFDDDDEDEDEVVQQPAASPIRALFDDDEDDPSATQTKSPVFTSYQNDWRDKPEPKPTKQKVERAKVVVAKPVVKEAKPKEPKAEKITSTDVALKPRKLKSFLDQNMREMPPIKVYRDVYPYPPEPMKLSRVQIQQAREHGAKGNINTFDYQKMIEPRILPPIKEPVYSGKYLSEMELYTECGIIVGHDGKQEENLRYTPLYCGHPVVAGLAFKMCAYHASFMLNLPRTTKYVQDLVAQQKARKSRFLIKG